MGCAILIPPADLLEDICRPNGSSGQQLAGFALLAGSQPSHRYQSGYFDSPDRGVQFQRLLESWTRIPRLEAHTLAKVKGAITWSNRRLRNLPMAHWFRHLPCRPLTSRLRPLRIQRYLARILVLFWLTDSPGLSYRASYSFYHSCTVHTFKVFLRDITFLRSLYPPPLRELLRHLITCPILPERHQPPSGTDSLASSLYALPVIVPLLMIHLRLPRRRGKPWPCGHAGRLLAISEGCTFGLHRYCGKQRTDNLRGPAYCAH